MTTTTTIFDHTSCPRCGGSGQHSYNQMHGSRCYGCGGRGFKLTSMGAKASAYLTSLLSKPAYLLQPGDAVRMDMGVSLTWATVTGIDRNGPVLTLRAKRGDESLSITGLAASDLIRVKNSAEEKTLKRSQALAYQASLT